MIVCEEGAMTLLCRVDGTVVNGEFLPQGPTYRLIPGVSRVSHADRVAAALGFSKEDVEKHLAARRT